MLRRRSERRNTRFVAHRRATLKARSAAHDADDMRGPPPVLQLGCFRPNCMMTARRPNNRDSQSDLILRAANAS
jgi:hypothetical protein